jgi:hypothetical protein
VYVEYFQVVFVQLLAFGEGGKAVDAYRNTDTAENGTNVTDEVHGPDVSSD